MTVGELRERLCEFDDSLDVRISDENFYMPETEDPDRKRGDECGMGAMTTNVELPAHEEYVVIYSNYRREENKHGT